jgi:hypothetical protein
MPKKIYSTVYNEHIFKLELIDCDKIIKHNKKEINMENISMKMGNCKDLNINIGISPYGLCVSNDNNTFFINNQTFERMEITGMEIFGNDMVYAIPTPYHMIMKGDTILYNNEVVMVMQVSPDMKIINYKTGEVKSIIQTKTMFGYNTEIKLTSMMNMNMNMNMGFPMAQNQIGMPFGNNPMMSMMMLMNNGSNNNDFIKKMMMMQYMNNFQQPSQNTLVNKTKTE